MPTAARYITLVVLSILFAAILADYIRVRRNRRARAAARDSDWRRDRQREHDEQTAVGVPEDIEPTELVSRPGQERLPSAEKRAEMLAELGGPEPGPEAHLRQPSAMSMPGPASLPDSLDALLDPLMDQVWQDAPIGRDLYEQFPVVPLALAPRLPAPEGRSLAVLSEAPAPAETTITDGELSPAAMAVHRYYAAQGAAHDQWLYEEAMASFERSWDELDERGFRVRRPGQGAR